MALHVQLYDRAADICRSITDGALLSENGVDSIISCLHKRYAIRIVSALFENFSLLLSTNHGENDSFKNFEMKFSAQVSICSAHGSSISLPECIIAVMLLVNPDVFDAQCISILSAPPSTAGNATKDVKSKGDFLQIVQNEHIPSVILLYD